MRYTITLTISEQWTVVWNIEEPDGMVNDLTVRPAGCVTQPALATSLLIAPELLAAMTQQAEQHGLSLACYIQCWLEKKLLEFGSTPM